MSTIQTLTDASVDILLSEATAIVGMQGTPEQKRAALRGSLLMVTSGTTIAKDGHVCAGQNCDMCREGFDRAERERANREHWAASLPRIAYIEDPEDRTNYLLNEHDRLTERLAGIRGEAKDAKRERDAWARLARTRGRYMQEFDSDIPDCAAARRALESLGVEVDGNPAS